MGLQLNPGKCEVISRPNTVINGPYLRRYPPKQSLFYRYRLD